MNAVILIVALAGTGERGYSGDGGPATQAKLDNPFDVCLFGDVVTFSDTNNHRVRTLRPGGKMYPTAGNGKKGYSGDGGPATEASFNEPYGVDYDEFGNLFIVDRLNFCIRRVDAKTQIINTVAGNGKSGISPDGIKAADAHLVEPNSICILKNVLYIADVKGQKIRTVDLKTGMIGTLVGTAEKKTVDGPLDKAALNGPRAVATGPDGCIYLVEREGNCVRKIDLAAKTIVRIAGTGKKGYSGDGGLAKDATFDGPKELDVDKAGNIFVVDTENEAIRRIDAKTGIITTVAGKGRTKTPGLGDGGDPLKATLGRPHGVAVGPDGAIYIGDTLSNKIRVVK